MAMVEVDPKLFIKCRLCLEDSGTYQIVPSVREQISYCFDINVEPFDGLPQLICKKCQSIICDYSKTKRSFIEKQDKLKKRTQIPQKTEPSDPAMAVKQDNSEIAANVNKRQRIRILSTSSNKSDCKSESSNQIVTDSAIIDESKTQGWMKDYTKTFSCRFCDSHWSKRKLAKIHKVKMHRNFEIKHADVLSKNCIVKLPKIDSKPNITGSTDQVVYSKKRIIAMGDIDFNISYNYTRKYNNSDSENEGSSSTSSTINVANVRRRPRRRICSRSSNETVVLENKNMCDPLENYICIDDSDSDDDTKKLIKKPDKCTAKMNAVAKLITIAHNRYLKKHEKPEKPPIEQLNRKIISIGRQIINKRGFNTSRLMKYMEHMNLDIIWLSRSPLNVTSNSNYFKIIPRCRYSTEKNIKHFEGYKKKYEKPKENKRKEVQAIETTEVSRKDPELRLAMLLTTDTENTLNLGLEPGLYSKNGTGPEIAQDLNAPLPDMRKLLNANPVANPKQLPKKFNSDAKKDKAQYTATMPTLEVNTKDCSEATFSGREDNIQMPIIAFTTSLADPQAEITPINNQPAEISTTPLNSNSEKPTGPRIKVKSVTELMSKETLKRMHKLDAPVTQNQQTYNGAAFGEQVTSTMSTINNARSISPTVYNCEDFVILDTVELPNTKTSSPFQYLRTLLQVHNLILLDTDATLTGDFNTLIKFKVLYNQESKGQPVILCLSLFCAGNTFCLKIKDRNEDNINMTKISANWQWEILKIYQGNVVVKILTNAKKISHEMYDYTNRFLCLLKSINFVRK